MLVGAKVCDLTEDLLWFVCGLYVGILTKAEVIVCMLEFFDLKKGGKEGTHNAVGFALFPLRSPSYSELVY